MILSFRILIPALALVLTAGCKSRPKSESTPDAALSPSAAAPKLAPVDRTRVFQFHEGFRFKLDLPGDWLLLPLKPQQVTAAQAPRPDTIPKMVLVRSGAADSNEMETPGGALGVFRNALERDPLNARLSRVTTRVKEAPHRGLKCLFFVQEGQDSSVPGGLTVRDDGMVCTHPERADRFIYMAVSARWRSGRGETVDLSAETHRLFDSLTTFN